MLKPLKQRCIKIIMYKKISDTDHILVALIELHVYRFNQTMKLQIKQELK